MSHFKTIRRSCASLIACASVGLIATTALAVDPPIKTSRIAPTAVLQYPVVITHAPGDTNRLFVVEKAGRIRIINLSTNVMNATSFLDINALVTGGNSLNDEQGLLGLAFDPNYATNGQFYVYYTDNAAHDVLARYTVSANPDVATLASGVIMMSWNDPNVGHNGGWLGFGPDGYLYMSVGDGGEQNDPSNRAQTIVNMRLGKIHRIQPTVGGASPYYTVPATNPFVGITGDDEIWSYGLRNPWRCSFDRDTGDFWVGDVGQNAVEEIDFQPAGTGAGNNYGWRCTEGTSCTGLSGCTCNGVTLKAPFHTYTHIAGSTGGFAVVGGYVYRGCLMPDLQGCYFFADYSNSNYWSFRQVAGVKTDFKSRNTELKTSLQGTTVDTPTCFGEDGNGELYIADNGGQIYKIVPATGDAACVPPPILGDLNHDGIVDGADLGALLADWGASTAADLNSDHTVDGADLGILLGNWTV